MDKHLIGVKKMNKSTNFRYNNSWYKLCGDGRFRKERIKGKDKKLLGKWSRKKMWKNIEVQEDV